MCLFRNGPSTQSHPESTPPWQRESKPASQPGSQQTSICSNVRLAHTQTSVLLPVLPFAFLHASQNLDSGTSLPASGSQTLYVVQSSSRSLVSYVLCRVVLVSCSCCARVVLLPLIPNCCSPVWRLRWVVVPFLLPMFRWTITLL